MENEKKKILLICNTSQGIYTFRIPLINKLKKEGFEVSVLAFDNKYEDLLKKEDVSFECINDSNRSTNPLKILSLKNKYYKAIKRINPDIVFTFQLKPNTFGVLAAKKAKIQRIYSMIEGAGDAFVNKSLKWKLIKFVECKLYKKALKHAKNVFFLNNDDKHEFEKLKLVKGDQGVVINGIGVDLNKFKFSPVDKSSNKFIMIARLMKAKGALDYCKCAEIVKKSHPEAEFLYLGAEGDIKTSDIQPYIDNGSINYLGTTTDVRPYIQSSLVLLLKSYREGMPMTVMEAQSMGRGVIVSNCVGCRETVKDGYNGFVVNITDYEAMAKKCIEILENKQLAVTFGKNARTFAEENFNQEKINQKIYNIISKNL